MELKQSKLNKLFSSICTFQPVHSALRKQCAKTLEESFIVTILCMCINALHVRQKRIYRELDVNILLSKPDDEVKTMAEAHGKALRHEYKYEIAPLQYQVLKKKVKMIFKPDPFAGAAGGYYIRTLYFDDFRNTSLFEKWSGIFHRERYRIRIYDYSDKKIKFERKTKIGEYILKEGATITRQEADKIIAGDINFLAESNNPLLKTFYIDSRQKLLHPVVIVEFFREAFYEPISHIRITFDSGLRASLSSTSIFDRNIPTVPVLDEPNIIIELKFSQIFPQHIKGLFPNDINPRLALGKFTLSRTQQLYLLGNLVGKLPFANKHSHPKTVVTV